MPRQRVPYGDGVYRRRIRLVAEPGAVVGELEDDFHHFRARIHHDGVRVTAAEGEALRFPWTSCPGATAPLRALEGMPLENRAEGHTDPRLQCTHLFDVTALAVAHAAAERTRRQYDVAVPDRRDGATRVELSRDGSPLLAWSLRGRRIREPEPWSGLTLAGREFHDWCRAHLDEDTLEAALVLRRASFIAMGRTHDFDAMRGPQEFLALTAGSCHTFQPATAAAATRVRGTTRDFTHHREALLSV
ncbi:MAG: DUF2889 domain-containing protein [Myxococcota bacterium]|nr:DUF2889 domain-containing protein [Myxococcota bacterium]